MRSSGTGWGVELLIVFVSGFLVATMLWLGLWFFWTKPAQGAALEVKEAAFQAKESALLNCVAAKNQCDELKEALLGWGRCIRGKNAPEAQQKPKGNTP